MKPGYCDRLCTFLWLRPKETMPVEIRRVLILITFSILGTYTRLGLIDLTEYTGSYVQGPTVLWANFTACFCMGLAHGVNKYGFLPPALFVGITTGYAGTVSSFSSVMLELFNHSTNQNPENAAMHVQFPNRAFGIMEFLSVLLVELGLSICGLVLGYHTANGCSEHLEGEKEEPSKLSGKLAIIMEGVEAASIVLALPFLVIQIVLSAVYSNFSREWTLSAVFGIFGTLARYYLSKWYNNKVKYFPLGTFFVNVLASLLLAIFELLARGKLADGTMIAKSVNTSRILGALGSGLCGAMSTISTFVNEGYRMPLKKAMIYFFISIFVSYCLVIITLGSYAWTRGLNSTAS